MSLLHWLVELLFALRFRLNAFPQRQDSNSSIRSDEDYGVSGCFNYSTGVTGVVIWNQIGHKAVRDLDCWKTYSTYQTFDLGRNFIGIDLRVIGVLIYSVITLISK